jgi:hypothetical protein
VSSRLVRGAGILWSHFDPAGFCLDAWLMLGGGMMLWLFRRYRSWAVLGSVGHNIGNTKSPNIGVSKYDRDMRLFVSYYRNMRRFISYRIFNILLI